MFHLNLLLMDLLFAAFTNCHSQYYPSIERCSLIELKKVHSLSITNVITENLCGQTWSKQWLGIITQQVCFEMKHSYSDCYGNNNSNDCFSPYQISLWFNLFKQSYPVCFAMSEFSHKIKWYTAKFIYKPTLISFERDWLSPFVFLHHNHQE